MLDEEIKSLAAYALVNAYWTEFSGLTNAWIAAGAGIDTDIEYLLGEKTSVYGRDCNVSTFVNVSIHTSHDLHGNRNHKTILAALEDKTANAVYVCGTPVFVRNDNWEWFYVGE